MRRIPRPFRWVPATAGCVVTVLLWFGVARSSGAGWVQAVGALLAGTLAWGLIAPAYFATRLSARCVDGPTDAVAGRPIGITVSMPRPGRIRVRGHRADPAFAAGPPKGERETTVTLDGLRRGVYDSLDLELATCAPFGLVWWGRVVSVPLARAIHVAPSVASVSARPLDPGRPDGTANAPLAGASTELRSVRPYAPGDRLRLVHWPGTAHTGELMVRETEAPARPHLVLELVLDDDPDVADAQAADAMARGGTALAQGATVTLISREASGARAGDVSSTLELGRRLARAVPD